MQQRQTSNKWSNLRKSFGSSAIITMTTEADVTVNVHKRCFTDQFTWQTELKPCSFIIEPCHVAGRPTPEHLRHSRHSAAVQLLNQFNDISKLWQKYGRVFQKANMKNKHSVYNINQAIEQVQALTNISRSVQFLWPVSCVTSISRQASALPWRPCVHT